MSTGSRNAGDRDAAAMMATGVFNGLLGAEDINVPGMSGERPQVMRVRRERRAPRFREGDHEGVDR